LPGSGKILNLKGTLKAMERDIKMVRVVDEHTVEVSLPYVLGYERVAMDCSASLAKFIGFSADRIDDLKTAVSEACMNAIEHGNGLRPDARVIVTMNFVKDAFTVSVMDEGKGLLDLPKKPDIAQKIKKKETPRGLGIYLMEQLMDQVEFNEITNGGHVVRMVIKMAN
jgi:serine/threonine-protein kinase RsbW